MYFSVSEVTKSVRNTSIAIYISSLLLLQLNANFHWIANTKAISYMTLYYHWFKTYTHCRRTVCLADNFIIYSADMEFVVFEPTIHI